MDYAQILSILIAICPTVSSMLSTICGFLYTVKKIREVTTSSQAELEKAYARIAKLESKLSIAVTKISSIERMLIEERERH